MEFTIPLLPALVTVAVASVLVIRFRRRWLAVIVTLTVGLLYAEHINRMLLISAACQEYAKFEQAGKPEPFEGIYMQLARKHTWQDLDDIIRQLPLNVHGRSVVEYVDADVAPSNFYAPMRHRFRMFEPQLNNGRYICGGRPDSAWAKEKAYTEIRDRLMAKGICFSIHQVKTGPEVKTQHCSEGVGWKNCTYFDVVEVGPDIPVYWRNVYETELGGWPSAVPVKRTTRILDGAGGRWHAQSTALNFGPEFDSWMVRLLALMGGDRTLTRQCFGSPVLPTVLYGLRS